MLGVRTELSEHELVGRGARPRKAERGGEGDPGERSEDAALCSEMRLVALIGGLGKRSHVRESSGLSLMATCWRVCGGGSERCRAGAEGADSSRGGADGIEEGGSTSEGGTVGDEGGDCSATDGSGAETTGSGRAGGAGSGGGGGS